MKITPGRVLLGCALLPVALIGSCSAKMSYDRYRYNLPGEVLQSDTKPTRELRTAMDVAETLDQYVQPRFEILRDKNFGAMRIVYRKHAGIVQLKVDSPNEHELIANVNGANRDYAICLYHCAKKPNRPDERPSGNLQLLYLNRQPVITDLNWRMRSETARVAAENDLDIDAVEGKVALAADDLMSGRERRTRGENWDVLMRPVLAAKDECLSCHVDERRGATLGVMVYAVRKQRRDEMKRVAIR